MSLSPHWRWSWLSMLSPASGLYLHNPYPHSIHTHLFHSGCTCQMVLPHAKLQLKLFYQLFRSIMGPCFICMVFTDLFFSPHSSWAMCLSWVDVYRSWESLVLLERALLEMRTVSSLILLVFHGSGNQCILNAFKIPFSEHDLRNITL